MKKLCIIVDCDEILAQLLPAWLAEYNKVHDQNVTVDAIQGWGIENYIPHGKEIYKILDTPGMFNELKPVEGALEALKSLHDKGHEILICTASAKLPDIAADKLRWIRRNIPWLTHDNVFIGRKKYKLKANVLIDDAPHNHKQYKEAWPDAHVLSIQYPYNRETKDLVNLDAVSYKDTRAAWAQIERYIDMISSH